MGCSSCSAKAAQNNSGTYVPPAQTACLYTEAQIDALLLVADAQELSLVQSQKNVYSANCLLFFPMIVPLLTKYGL